MSKFYITVDNGKAMKHILSNKICPKCGTLLIENHTQLVKDYCPKCKDGLVYVIDAITGKGEQRFLNATIRGKKE